MKKCMNPQDGDLPERNDKEAISPLKKTRKKLFKRLKMLKFRIKKTIKRPDAPYNTTQYIMEQHPLITYDPEELLGSFLGISLVYKK